MAPMEQKTTPNLRLGSVLVALQFGLITALLLLNAPPWGSGPLPWGALGLAVAGLLLGAWALWANPPGNFNIHPVPRAGGRLIQQGPYRWIRHPMYSCVLACGFAAAWSSASFWAWSAQAALCLVLLIKAALEERWMVQSHPAYGHYRAHSWRLLPGIF
jgi:protein-S-isoprenylcysteine O-methyltransferase Ste14